MARISTCYIRGPLLIAAIAQPYALVSRNLCKIRRCSEPTDVRLANESANTDGPVACLKRNYTRSRFITGVKRERIVYLLRLQFGSGSEIGASNLPANYLIEHVTAARVVTADRPRRRLSENLSWRSNIFAKQFRCSGTY